MRAAATKATASARSGSGPVTIHLDRDLCQGHAVCVSEAPELFRLGQGEHTVTLLADEAPAELRKKVDLAVKHCPTRALSVREKS